MKKPSTAIETFPITQRTLAELNVIGLNHDLNVQYLTYVETQQILTIYSLIQLFNDHGIEVPFHLEIEGLYNERK